MAELNRNGIPTGVLMAPLMPGINDAPEQVEKIVELATEANATYIGGQMLFLRGSVRDIFFEWLREHRPDLVERYERLYAKGAYLSAGERRKLELAAGRAVGTAGHRRPVPQAPPRRRGRAAAAETVARCRNPCRRACSSADCDGYHGTETRSVGQGWLCTCLAYTDHTSRHVRAP